MKITKASMFTGIQHTRDIPITLEKFTRYMLGGVCIQDLCPELSKDDREFLISGITPEEWAELFGDEDDYCADCGNPVEDPSTAIAGGGVICTNCIEKEGGTL